MTMTYPFPVNDREAQRLRRQGEFYAELSRGVLGFAGIKGAMDVLDLACGTGELTWLVAERLDKHGRVTAIDNIPTWLHQASSMAQTYSAKCRVSFKPGEVQGAASHGKFDAIVGRMFLMYLPDPVSVLRSLQAALNPDGLIVMQEPDHSSYLSTDSDSPLYNYWHQLVMRTCVACKIHISSGLQLRAWMEAAGYTVNQEVHQERVDSGPDSPVYDVLAEVVHAFKSQMVEKGIIRSEDEVPDDLADQLRGDAVKHQRRVFSSKLIGVIGRI